jgi:hypothetical protein
MTPLFGNGPDPARKGADFPLVLADVNRSPTVSGSNAELSADRKGLAGAAPTQRAGVRSAAAERLLRSNVEVDPQTKGATASRKRWRQTAEPRWVVPRRGVVQCLSRMRGNLQVRLCVQKRLMCPAGVSPAGARIGSPVARRAGRRETDGPEAPRQPHRRVSASGRAVTKVNAWWPRK